jgi:hypothetical protein
MNLKTIKLDNNSYHEYLEGKEIRCSTWAIANKSLAEGEHVLVYKDTVAAGTSLSPPKSEMQSEYIGVEGEVTRVNLSTGDQAEIAIRKL